mmetsp:Transcript_5225/g.18798  ORF Transcript_5225/g.18798 Transcript_5225/m.18798 type:complete len:242 (+) Transcript_5225:2069-2794(+)
MRPRTLLPRRAVGRAAGDDGERRDRDGRCSRCGDDADEHAGGRRHAERRHPHRRLVAAVRKGRRQRRGVGADAPRPQRVGVALRALARRPHAHAPRQRRRARELVQLHGVELLRPQRRRVPLPRAGPGGGPRGGLRARHAGARPRRPVRGSSAGGVVVAGAARVGRHVELRGAVHHARAVAREARAGGAVRARGAGRARRAHHLVGAIAVTLGFRGSILRFGSAAGGATPHVNTTSRRLAL